MNRSKGRLAVFRNYEMWVGLTRVGYWEMRQMRNEASQLPYQPRVSILVPVYNTLEPFLGRALDTVMGQTYPNWELCICDDASTSGYVRETLSRYERLDERIKVKRLSENTGIGEATNHAFSLASGEFVGLLDHDDELAPNALFEVVKFLQDQPDADLVYSDEDKIDERGERARPVFKISWSPDLALSCNYLNHFSVYRRTILEEIGGWRQGFDGAQDLDLVQRFSERTDKIFHIPKILYHWRTVPGSTALGSDSKPYTHEKTRLVFEDVVKRREIAGSVRDGFAPNTVRIEREILGQPRVSVVIPVSGQIPSTLVDSLRRRTSYPNYEIVAVDVESGAITKVLESGEHEVLEKPEYRNLSGLYNAAIRRTDGEYALILNPELEALSEGWLENLLQHAQRPEVGAVGGKLTFPQGDVFQAGLILDDGTKSQTNGTPRFYRYCNPRVAVYRYLWDLNSNCSAVSWDCIMFRKDVFEEVGGFDEDHFGAEFADVDLCLRMRERGYLIVYTPYAEFTYHGSTRRYSTLSPTEVAYVRERWGYILGADPYYNPNMTWDPEDSYPVRDIPDAPGSRKQRAPVPDKNTEVDAPVGAGASPPTPITVMESETLPAAAPLVVSTHQKSVVLPPPFFIVGHGRSGTTWLEKTLNSHPETLCKGEGMFFGRNKRMRETHRTLPHALASSNDLRIWHDMRDNRWSDRAFEEDLPGMVKAITSHVLGTELAMSGKLVAGDKTPHYATCLDEVYELYPDAKIIHIIRDGRDVIISNMHAAWQNAKDKGGPVGLSRDEIKRRDAYIKDREEFLKSGESIFSETRISRLSRSWDETVRKGREDGSMLFGNNYFEIRYEDLLNDPHSELERLFGFLGVDTDPEVIDQIVEDNRFEKMAGRPRGEEDARAFHRKGIHGDWEGVFNGRDKRIFKEEAGDLLVELGYEKDMDW